VLDKIVRLKKYIRLHIVRSNPPRFLNTLLKQVTFRVLVTCVLSKNYRFKRTLKSITLHTKLTVVCTLQQIPIWWRRYYWVTPVAWTLYGLVTSQVGDKNGVVDVPRIGDVPLKMFLERGLGFDYDFLPAVAVAHVGWVLLFFFVFAYGIKFLNFQRR
jgi:hypothetical protein